jgi:hypothetical protein
MPHVIVFLLLVSCYTCSIAGQCLTSVGCCRLCWRRLYRRPVVPSKLEGTLHCSMYPLHLLAVAGCVGAGYTDVPWSCPNRKGRYIAQCTVYICMLLQAVLVAAIQTSRGPVQMERDAIIAPCTLYIRLWLQAVLVAAIQTSRGPVQTGRDATWPQSAPSSSLWSPPKAGSQQSSTSGNSKLIDK